MQAQTKKKDKIQELEQRIEQIERMVKGSRITNNSSTAHIQKILQKTGGILTDKKINPIDWQKKMRDEWDEREKRELTV